RAGAARAGELHPGVGHVPRSPGIAVAAPVRQPVRGRDDFPVARGADAIARARRPDLGWRLVVDSRADRPRARLVGVPHPRYPDPGLHIHGADDRLSVDGARASLMLFLTV